MENDKFLLNKELEFFEWYKKIIYEGYEPILDYQQILLNVDYVSEIYKNRFDRFNVVYNKNENIIDFERLFTQEMILLLHSFYRSKGLIKGSNEFNSKIIIPIINFNTNKTEYIIAKQINGKVLESPINNKENLNISNIIEELQKINKYDYNELKKVLKNNIYDKMVRSKLIELIAVKIITDAKDYSLGYKRAIKFIKDIKAQIPTLDVNAVQIRRATLDLKKENLSLKDKLLKKVKAV